MSRDDALTVGAWPWDLRLAPDRAAAALELAQRLLGNPSPPPLAAWVERAASSRWVLHALTLQGWRTVALPASNEADASVLPDGSRRAHALALAEAWTATLPTTPARRLAAGRGGE